MPKCGDPEHLRALVQAFVRRFGLLLSGETPCGQAVPKSYAHALMVLLEHAETRDEMSQADLGAVLGIDKSNVARLCSRMQRQEHVTQERAEHDRRSRLVSLTTKGRRLARTIERSSGARFRRILQGIPPNERPTVFAGLTSLNEAVAGTTPRSRS